MNQILKKVRDVDPNDSEAVKEALSPFFLNLSKHVEVDCSTWLRALENAIDRFPKYCTSQRSTIETYLAHFLSSNNYYDVIEAAKCAHILQQVRPSQDKAATAKACWREQVNILCNAAHSLIEELFTNSVNIFKNSTSSQQNVTSVLANCPLTEALIQITKVKKMQHKKAILVTRLKNVLVFLQAMLVEIYPVAKPIRPQIILEVVVRALSASSGNAEGVDVSTVKIQALRTSDALVECLGPNLIPFSALIFRFVMQTLRWTSDKLSDESIKVRCKAYDSLGEWLRMLHVYRPAGGGGGGGAGTGGATWEDELTAHVIGDVTPPQRQMQLTMSTQPTKNLSKKAKRRLANTMLQESSIATHIPGEKNKITVTEEVSDEVAIAALECAEMFFTACGIFLKPTTHKIFVERIVRECYSAASHGAARALRLLHALDALRRSAPRAAPAHAHHCLHLYSTLLNSRRREISTFCSQALLDMRLHLHCSPPSLNFALQPLPEKKTEDNRKRVSERNRAVLESLLGAERMPSEDQEEDVISIPDEPSSKKICLQQNITDKISVSSDSVSSVEISDDSAPEDGFMQVVEVVIEEVKEDCTNLNEVDIVPVIEESTESDSSVDTIPEPKTLVEIETSLNNQANLKLTIEQTIRSSEIIIEQFNDIENVMIQPNKTVRGKDIFEAKTQMPVNTSNDTLDDEETPLSMEVAYDYPNTGQEKVTVLEKMDDENLPSTNDTDDIQITCGQDVKISQGDTDKNTDNLEQDVDKNNECAGELVPKENGVDKSTEKVVANGDVGIETSDVSVKNVSKHDCITVEDMLADFVDEVNDESQSAKA